VNFGEDGDAARYVFGLQIVVRARDLHHLHSCGRGCGGVPGAVGGAADEQVPSIEAYGR
jgi:hypothetical protein